MISDLKDRIVMLNGWMADIKNGQRMVFSFKPGVGLTARVNGTVKGTIKGDDFRSEGPHCYAQWLDGRHQERSANGVQLQAGRWAHGQGERNGQGNDQGR